MLFGFEFLLFLIGVIRTVLEIKHMLLKFVKVNEVVEDVMSTVSESVSQSVSLNIRGLVGFEGLVEMVDFVLRDRRPQRKSNHP